MSTIDDRPPARRRIGTITGSTLGDFGRLLDVMGLYNSQARLS
jgi:hypothetical protein